MEHEAEEDLLEVAISDVHGVPMWPCPCKPIPISMGVGFLLKWTWAYTGRS